MCNADDYHSETIDLSVQPRCIIKLSDGGLLCTADNRILKSSDAGRSWKVLCGSKIPGFADGVGETARFDHPESMAQIGENVYVCDSLNNRIRCFNLRTLNGTTVAGSGKPDGRTDCFPLEEGLSCPRYVTFNRYNDSLDVAAINGEFILAVPTSTTRRGCMSIVRSILPARMSEWSLMTIESYAFDSVGTSRYFAPVRCTGNSLARLSRLGRLGITILAILLRRYVERKQRPEHSNH